MATETVFSEYEVREIAIKLNGQTPEDTAHSMPCVGSVEEEMETLVVTKNCRGMVAKTRVKGTGAGTLTISAHIPSAIYNSIYGMNLAGLVEGVKAYGRNSVHPEFTMTLHVFDEDGNEKFKAYPCCVMQSGVTRTTENGAEEVAEVEIEVSVMPDENGNGLYEVEAKDLGTDEAQLKTKWMTQFKPDLVQAPEA